LPFRIKNTMGKFISILSQDKNISGQMNSMLLDGGYHVEVFADLETFWQSILLFKPHLVVLDKTFFNDDILALCNRLRGEPRLEKVIIFILASEAQEIDKILALEVGADDYLVKPFSMNELRARIKALLRRGYQQSQAQTSADVVSLAPGIGLDIESRLLLVNGKKETLTGIEFDLLRLLSSKQGWVFSRQQILDELWPGRSIKSRNIDVYICHLRTKLGNAAHIIKNLHSIGYKIDGEIGNK
jgi:two-component system, OmpR family, alkaline phosphatase synthesis response regulator PhoP